MTRFRPILVLVLICSLALAGLSRNWADQLRHSASVDLLGNPETGRNKPSENRLSNMDSYALALLLGGLRGPLVMFLWSTSETQKSAHDLEDFDTKVEWIRLLQPEFDTVHLFQIWNKAYNVSVQMANLPNKYAAILDALDYADSVDRQRPDDINIVDSIANLFGDKMAGMQLPLEEKQYYLRRVTQDTSAPRPLERVTFPDARLNEFIIAARAAGMDAPSLATEVNDQAKTLTVTLEVPIAQAVGATFFGPGVEFKSVTPAPHYGSAAIRRTHLDPMLDLAGNLLPELIAPTHPRPAGMAPDAPWYDGSDLQFLVAYQPFPYGISPEALGFNYYKRTQMLSRVAHEQHLQKSDYVIDSRPALSLRSWAGEAGESGRRAELRLFGIDDHGERKDLEGRAPAAATGVMFNPGMLASRPDPAAGTRALFEYARAVQLNHDAVGEYQGHLLLYPQSRSTFLSHIADARGFGALYQADHDFLQGLLDPASKSAAWAAAADHYRQAIEQFQLIILQYFVDDDMARLDYPTLPDGTRVHREVIDQLPADQRLVTFRKVMADMPTFYKNHLDPYGDDRKEYLNYLDRCTARMELLQHEGMSGASAPATAAPPPAVQTVK